LIAPLVGCSGDDQVDMSRTVTDTNAPPVNLAAEITRAQSENKLLLLEFGSSDSCPPCVRFQQQVFSTPEFAAYAKTSLDFVHLDFPLKHDLRKDTSATNVLLSEQFGAYLFPTFVVLDKNGKPIWKMPKSEDEDPDFDTLYVPTNFINLMQKLKLEEK
jgi:thioredoxin-related protein